MEADVLLSTDSTKWKETAERVIKEAAEKDPSILDEAKSLVHGPRQAAYHHPFDDYTETAQIFSAILKTPVTAEQAILCMIGVKLSRLSRNITHRDSCVDLAGYAECLDMTIQERKRRESEQHNKR